MVGVVVFQPMYNGVLQIARSASSPCAHADGRHSSFFRAEHRSQSEYPFRCIEIANLINMWSRTCEHLQGRVDESDRFSYLWHEALDLMTFLLLEPCRPLIWETHTHARTTNFLGNQPRYCHKFSLSPAIKSKCCYQEWLTKWPPRLVKPQRIRSNTVRMLLNKNIDYMHDPSRSRRNRRLSGNFVQTNSKMPIKRMDYVRGRKEQIQVVKP